MEKFYIKILALFMVVSTPLFAEWAYLVVEKEQLASRMTELNTLVVNMPGTTKYTSPIYSPIATVTTVLVLVDDRAKSVLTEEEWNSRLATMPVEFIREVPK